MEAKHDDEIRAQASEPENELRLTEEQRREFLAKAAKLAIGSPMAALLLATPTDEAHAVEFPSGTGPSDRRLKTDVERIGTGTLGLPVYTFRYRWDPQHFVGVMADEVERVMPEAVSVHASGYQMVDYGMLLA